MYSSIKQGIEMNQSSKSQQSERKFKTLLELKDGLFRRFSSDCKVRYSRNSPLKGKKIREHNS